MTDQENPFFDPQKFGEQLRDTRKKAGFSSLAAFSQSIEQETGISIHQKTLQKLERGVGGVPSVEKVAAIIATLQTERLGRFSQSSFERLFGSVIFGSLSDNYIYDAKLSDVKSEIKTSVERLSNYINSIEQATYRLATKLNEIDSFIHDKNSISVSDQTPLYEDDLDISAYEAASKNLLSMLPYQINEAKKLDPGLTRELDDLLAKLDVEKARLLEAIENHKAVASNFG